MKLENEKVVTVYWLTPTNLRTRTFNTVSEAVSFAETLDVECYSISVHNLFSEEVSSDA